MATDYTKTCPECGAENNSTDLFCKDCGASLAMVPAGSQQTAAFTPINNGAETQTTTIAPTAPPPMNNFDGFAAVPAAQPLAHDYGAEPESSRGAVLGWLAATLMLIVVAAFIWSTVVSDSTRDSITGIF